MYFDIGGSSSVFFYRRVVQCVLILEGYPMNLIGGLSNVCPVNLSDGCPME